MTHPDVDLADAASARQAVRREIGTLGLLAEIARAQTVTLADLGDALRRVAERLEEAIAP